MNTLNNLGKRGSVIAVWVFVAMTVVACLTTAYFFVRHHQAIGNSFSAVSSGFYFQMEKDRIETMLGFYVDEAIFLAYNETIDLISSNFKFLDAYQTERNIKIIYGSYLGDTSSGNEFNDFFEHNLKIRLKDPDEWVFVDYSDNKSKNEIKEAMKNAVVSFDGENIKVIAPSVVITYNDSGIYANYSVDLKYDVSFSELSLFNLHKVHQVIGKCRVDRKYIMQGIRETEDNCIIDFFKPLGFELYGFDYSRELLGKKYSAPASTFKYNNESYRVFPILSKKKYLFADSLQNIGFNFMWRD